MVRKSYSSFIIAFFAMAAFLSLAAGQAHAQQSRKNLVQSLQANEKINFSDEILAKISEGAKDINVIVLVEPSPQAQSLAVQSQQSAEVPEEFRRPGAGVYYNLQDETVRQQLKATVAETVDAVVEQLDTTDVTVTRTFSYLFGFSATVTPKGLWRLVTRPDVIAIEEDHVLEAHLAQGVPLINASTVRNTYTGAGVSIAICDTGIDTSHPMLGGGGSPIFNAKVIGGYDTGDNDADPRPGSFGNPHGSACAGIAAGDDGSVGDYIGGVAPDAKLYAVKISTGTTGSASGSAMIAGWEWAITHQNDDPANPIMIISTSFGGGRYFSTCNSTSTGMTQAAANAVAAGITIFASSGNEGYCDSMGWPACITHVNSVGAVYDSSFGNYYPCVSASSCAPRTPTGGCSTGWYATDNTSADLVTSYSNSASFLTLFAPSNQAYTADITGAGGYASGDYTSSFGGTSAACPYAAGAAALLQEAARDTTGSYLAPATVQQYLVDNGDNLTDSKVAITKPRVNVGNAINAIPGLADLVVQSPAVDLSNMNVGDTYTFSATVHNQGSTTSASTTLRYYQSTNSTISTADLEIGTDGVGNLPSGGNSPESAVLNAPGSAGTYWIGGCVDPVAESDTTNNCSSGVQITVSNLPAIARAPGSLSRTITQGQNAAGQSFTVWNSGGGTLIYAISDNATWLSASPVSGTSTGETDTINVTYSTSGLGVGPYNATITISDPGATNSPQTIAVNLVVNPVGCTDLDSDGYGDPGDPACPNGPEQDCDDSNDTVYPGAPELCDELDNNCDLVVDENACTDIYVELTETCGGFTPCTSSIQEAVDMSALGATIRVAQGTYRENCNVENTNPRDFLIEGGWDAAFTARTSDPSLTAFDGDLDDDGAGDVSVFQFLTQAPSTFNDLTASLTNVTIQNGRGSGFLFSEDVSAGGGIQIVAYEDAINIHLDRVHVIQNTAAAGGGIYANEWGFINVTIDNSIIADNTSSGNGGGIWLYGVPLTMNDSTLSANVAAGRGGGVYIYETVDETTTMRNSTVADNQSGSDGGGFYFHENVHYSVVILEGNSFTGNTASNNGGGIYVETYYQDAPPVVLDMTNNIIADNSALRGGGLYVESMFLGEIAGTLLNNTVTQNSDGIYVYSYDEGTLSLDILNTIAWGNVGPDITCYEDDTQQDSSVTVNASHSDINVVDNTGAVYNDDLTNVNLNPDFVDPVSGDYHLRNISSLIDAGTNSGAPSDDFDGDLRPFDGDGDSIAVTDIGADEFYPTMLPGAFSKTDQQDGVINGQTEVILSWQASLGALSYSYCVDTVNNSICDGQWIDVGTDTFAYILDLALDTTYYWQARALNASGQTEADAGIWWSFTMPPTYKILFWDHREKVSGLDN